MCARKVSQLLRWSILSAFALCLVEPGRTAADAGSLVGTWTFVADSSGRTANVGAGVTLTFTADRVSASVGGVQDSAPYTVSGDSIDFVLGVLGKTVSGHYDLIGNVLILPFKVFSDGAGTSTWQRQGASGAAGEKGDKGDKGDKSDKGATGAQGAGGEKGAKGDKGEQGPAGKDAKPCDTWVGNYEGQAEGQEVRFRRRGILELVVKHAAGFFFHVDKSGSVEGEGSIVYSMAQDTSGLEAMNSFLTTGFNMAWAWPLPSFSIKGSTISAGGISSGTFGGMAAMGPMRYEAPHLKNNPEARRFKFKGKLIFQTGPNAPETGTLVLEQVGDFTLPDGTVDNKLITSYFVADSPRRRNNEQQTEVPFPCWSPFLTTTATVRRAAGEIFVAQFFEKGTHRNGVQPWQEFTYLWLARQINCDPGPEKKK